MKAILSKQDFDSRIKRVLISEEEIAAAIEKAGREIDKLYDGRPILLVSVLKGAFVFMADLCRAVSVPCEIGFMCAKSYYEGTVSTGVVKITMDLDRDISGYHVVIVEDIIDTGRTLHDVVKLLKARNPLSLHVVTLLDKPSRRLVDFKADYSLFTIPDHFVIGYGLDCAEYFRNLPYIAESRLVLCCRKLYAADLEQAGFLLPELLDNYKTGDFHRMYVVEIEQALLAQ